MSSDEPQAVTTPLQKEFPGAIRPHAIFAQCAASDADSAILYFVAASQECFALFPSKLDPSSTVAPRS
jgi:hypothetical protein